jgi:hypothetical protein
VSVAVVVALNCGAAALAAPPSVAMKRPLPPPNTVVPPPPVVIPSTEALVGKMRTVALALNRANRTGDYTALRALGTKRFQAENSPEKLAQDFAPFRSSNVDLSRVADVTPQLVGPPGLEGDSIKLAGTLPGSSEFVTFDLSFEPEGGVWTMSKMAFSFTPVVPTPL